MTLEQAKKLKYGDIVYHVNPVISKWRISGKVKTWKRDTSRIKITIKRGLYSYGYITEDNLHLFEKETK